MALLVEWGLEMWNTYSILFNFLSREFQFPFPLYINEFGVFEFEIVTVTPVFLMVGLGIEIVLVCKLYKFILDLIPFA